MNKNSQILRPRQKLSLGDLILAVSSCAKSSRETVATVADLLGSGQVRVEDHGPVFARQRSAKFGKVIFKRSGGCAAGAFSL